MDILEIRDKERIERFLRNNTPMHMYELGDLDDDFFPDTQWFAGMFEDELIALALVYNGLSVPTLIALDQETDALRDLLMAVRKSLPDHFYAHLSSGLESALKSRYKLETLGPHYKMILSESALVNQCDTSEVIHLDSNDIPDLISLYEESYPESWFDPAAFRNGVYTGIRLEDRLISVAATHVYHEKYRLAALGNITTHPDHRNRGYGARVVSGLCKVLLDHTDHIGLNVKVSNKSAIKLYENLGFRKIGTYHEYLLTG
jgi:ribosomal protein S18 acetylase RimI-like enzyme